MRATRRGLFAFLVLGVSACGAVDRAPEADPNAVVFRLEAANAERPGRIGWLATHESGGKVARFRIELVPEPKNAKLPTFSRCAIVREAGSDGSALLHDLARALEGRVPPPGTGVQGFDVPVALLGRDLSLGGSGNRIAGRFGSEPKGSWISMKLFLGEGEVFLNLDPVGGFGEFSLKDSDYAAEVMKELGRLFQGEPLGGFVELDAASPAEAPEAPPVPIPTANPDAARVSQLSEQAAPGVSQPTRRKALESLASMGPRARDAVPAFLEALTDPDPLIREEAVQGLPRLKPDPQIGIAAVTPLLKDAHAINQVWAAEALAQFGDTPKAVIYLTVFLKGDAKEWAAAGLARIGPDARGAVPLLTEMLKARQSPGEGYAASRALAAIGRDASSALPVLRDAAQDVNKSVRDAANYAIREIEGR